MKTEVAQRNGHIHVLKPRGPNRDAMVVNDGPWAGQWWVNRAQELLEEARVGSGEYIVVRVPSGSKYSLVSVVKLVVEPPRGPLYRIVRDNLTNDHGPLA